RTKIMGNENTKGNQLLTPAGINSMDEALQKKFSKGIQYNMKIVIRGDRNTGKTNLFRRMEGKQFSEAYTPTTAINVTSILWSYKVTSDTVKVEVWDVVDKGKPQKKGNVPLKLANEAEQDEEGGVSLDADFLDVYKNTNGVVFVYDITKLWTWQYIERELPRVPMHIPIIILGNFRDMEQHRVITSDIAVSFIEHLNRPEGAAIVRYAEGSMRDAFGLMHLYKFLSIPFLHLQQEALLQQLKSNREQVLAANEELEAASKAEDQNYELYKETMSKKTLAEKERRRKEKEEMEALKRKEQETQPSAPAEKKKKEKEAQEKEPAPEPTKRSEPADKQARDSTDSPPLSTEDSDKLVESVPNAAAEPKEKGPAPVSTSLKTKLSSRFAGFMSKSKQAVSVPTATALPAVSKPKTTVASSEAVEEFVPEGEGVQTFLGEEDEGGRKETVQEEKQASDDDDEEEVAINPLVARDEDLSSLEGEEPPAPAKKEEKKGSTAVQRDVSSDGEEDGKKVSDKGRKPVVVQPDDDLSSDDQGKNKRIPDKGKKALTVVQKDEDVSSDDEAKKKTSYSNGKKPSIVQQDEDISSDEGEGKQKLVITADKDISSDEDQSRKPTKSALPPKASPKAAALPKVQLKSAKEIVLTESEGDGEEEQSPEDATAILKPVTVKPISQGFMSFDLSDVTKSSPAVAVKASSGGQAVKASSGGQKGSGLLLGWKDPQPQSSPEMPEKSVKPAPTNGSPAIPSKKEKKSSSKKEHREHREDREGKDGESKSKKSSKKSKDDGEKAKKKGDDMKQEPADPFAPLSLDAWLDGDDDTKDVERTDGDDGKGKHKKKKHKSESGKKSKRKASDGGEDYGQL
ncbi:hypothetical protein EMCRGX_G020149, partial [Ephydatia muelleri]